MNKLSQSQVFDDKAFGTRRASHASAKENGSGIPPAGKKKVSFKVAMPKK